MTSAESSSSPSRCPRTRGGAATGGRRSTASAATGWNWGSASGRSGPDGLTQAEIARAVGAEGHSTVAAWESGVNVPEGLRRERLIELLEGRRWPELWAAAIVGEGLPAAWGRGVRWYRRASRERGPRQSVGAVVAAILEELQAATSEQALRERYCERDGDWARGVAARQGLGEEHQADLRRVEDAAFGLRWLELAHGLQFDPGRSLTGQIRLALLDDAMGGRGSCGLA